MAVIYIVFTSFLTDAKNYQSKKNMATMQGKEKILCPFLFKLPSCIPLRMPLVRFKVLDVSVHRNLLLFRISKFSATSLNIQTTSFGIVVGHEDSCPQNLLLLIRYSHYEKACCYQRS